MPGREPAVTCRAAGGLSLRHQHLGLPDRGRLDRGGKGPSIWDTFAHLPDRIVDGSTGDVACDHYHRYPEDVALMKRLGAKGYRFSDLVAADPAARVRRGQPGQGLDFYDRLVDELSRPASSPW